MKKFSKYFLILFISFSNNIFCQEIIIPIQNQITNTEPIENIVYFKDTDNLLNKFTGVWEYSDAVNYLKITITKQTHVSKGKPIIYNDNDFEDLLIVQILFKQNNIIKYNNIKGIGGNYIIDMNTVELNYYEPSFTSCFRAKNATLKLKVINNFMTNEMIWTRTNQTLIDRSKCSDGTELDNSDFIIPENIILTKIN